ncbi:hypothetical protein [Nannocystis pusilla]|uniref:hypothetical protein n=1 Tax=Nannocystis pusilla TaxID=889268 RepID=UPI003DA4BFF6
MVVGRTQKELEPLQGLTEITGSLLVQDNPDLVELPPFPLLRRIGRSLAIAHNDLLAEVHGFPVLEDLFGEIYVGANPQLAAFTLASGPLTIETLFVALNPSLVELRLPEIIEIKDDLRVMSNGHLQTLEVPELALVGRDFLLDDNPWLETIDFAALHAVETWTLSGNAKLASLAGFPALRKVTAAWLTDNDSLSAVRWAASVEYFLRIEDNDSLQYIEGTSPEHVFRLGVANNLSLHGIYGFSTIQSLDRLWIKNNPALAELKALPALESIDQLSIIDNQAFLGPNDILPGLTEVTGDLSIYGNSQLPPGVVETLLLRVNVAGSIRVGDNQGQMTEHDPCPWPNDGVCDELMGLYDVGTGLCASDQEDCAPMQ